MRLTFPNGDHPDVPVTHGRLGIGRRGDNTVVLQAAGIADRHALIVSDLGGTWLCLEADASPAHVNARPVRRLALLRPGDVVTLEGVRIVLAGHVAALDADVPAQPPERTVGLRVVLRGVAGAHFGRSYALDVPRVIGRGNDADVRVVDPAVAERHAQIELVGQQVVLRSLAADGCQVNGLPVRDCVLQPGDQIVVEQHRFVLEAPLREAPTAAPVVDALAAFEDLPPAPEAEAEPVEEGPGTMVWWLLLSALGLAAAIAALLVYAPGLSG